MRTDDARSPASRGCGGEEGYEIWECGGCEYDLHRSEGLRGPGYLEDPRLGFRRAWEVEGFLHPHGVAEHMFVLELLSPLR